MYTPTPRCCTRTVRRPHHQPHTAPDDRRFVYLLQSTPANSAVTIALTSSSPSPLGLSEAMYGSPSDAAIANRVVSLVKVRMGFTKTRSSMVASCVE